MRVHDPLSVLPRHFVPAVRSVRAEEEVDDASNPSADIPWSHSGEAAGGFWANLGVSVLCFKGNGCGSKLHSCGSAGFSLAFHLPGFHFGPRFLSHTQITQKTAMFLKVPLASLFKSYLAWLLHQFCPQATPSERWWPAACPSSLPLRA